LHSKESHLPLVNHGYDKPVRRSFDFQHEFFREHPNQKSVDLLKLHLSKAFCASGVNAPKVATHSKHSCLISGVWGFTRRGHIQLASKSGRRILGAIMACGVEELVRYLQKKFTERAVQRQKLNMSLYIEPSVSYLARALVAQHNLALDVTSKFNMSLVSSQEPGHPKFQNNPRRRSQAGV
jgi:hypothetical protein